MSREKYFKNQEDACRTGIYCRRAHPMGQSNGKTPPHGPMAGFSTNQLGCCPRDYFRERLEAFSGLTFWEASATLVLAWVARLQLPVFHLVEGSGQAAQYHPEEISSVRLHPLHCSTIS
jgi:hypothetical protein